MSKRKKKVSVNAIDKYIKQIKYRAESKKPEKSNIRQPKVVISRIRLKRLKNFINPDVLDRNKNQIINIEAPVAKISRKRRVKVSKDDNPVSSDFSQEKNKGTRQLENLVSDSDLKKKTSNDSRTSPKKKIRKSVSFSDVQIVEIETAEKLKPTIETDKNVKKSIKKSCSRTRSIVKAVNRRNLTQVRNTVTKNHLSSASSENNENVLVATEEPISENQTVPTALENLEDTSPTEPDLVLNEPCLCESSNFNIEEPNAITKESLIPNKYRPCMEELKSLTAESITKFVMDNQQYYKDFRKAGHVRKVPTNGKKRPKNEFKDSFKCNPFDSSQQISMYMALREIFQVPADSFLECRNFFTLLIPEICCQLFAQIFKIKTSFAPRLIKKFYSKPVCPV